MTWRLDSMTGRLPSGGVARGFIGAALLGLAACGGEDGDTSGVTSRHGPARTALPEDPATPAVASGVEHGNRLPDLDDLALPDEAKSFVDVWKLAGLSMSRSFVHYHEPPRPHAPGWISLMYGARDAAGRSLQLEWAYDGQEVSYDYSDLRVAPSYVVFRDETARREWRLMNGHVTLAPQADGRVRIDLTDLEIAESLGVEEGEPEPIANGFVIGEVERVCIEYVTVDGAPINGETGQSEPQAQRDQDWSSPFCARFAP